MRRHKTKLFSSGRSSCFRFDFPCMSLGSDGESEEKLVPNERKKRSAADNSRCRLARQACMYIGMTGGGMENVGGQTKAGTHAGTWTGSGDSAALIRIVIFMLPVEIGAVTGYFPLGHNGFLLLTSTLRFLVDFSPLVQEFHASPSQVTHSLSQPASRPTRLDRRRPRRARRTGGRSLARSVSPSRPTSSNKSSKKVEVRTQMLTAYMAENVWDINFDRG